jgi:hypothetical protein
VHSSRNIENMRGYICPDVKMKSGVRARDSRSLGQIGRGERLLSVPRAVQDEWDFARLDRRTFRGARNALACQSLNGSKAAGEC